MTSTTAWMPGAALVSRTRTVPEPFAGKGTSALLARA
jgi:hypothetical protein